MPISKFSAAQTGKNDEFYTQYDDIEQEMQFYTDYNPDVFRDKTILLPCDDPEWSNFTSFFASHFQKFGIKKLISTCYAIGNKQHQQSFEPTLFEKNSPQYDKQKSLTNGKIMILERDVNGDGKINLDDLEWQYLKGTGDFRSQEVTALRDEADIIITNPPFSMFREFLDWILTPKQVDDNTPAKHFIIIGNMNAVTFKEVFPLLKQNTIWVGGYNVSLVFKTPYANNLEANKKFVQSKGYDPDDNYVKTPAIAWFTNIEHTRRRKYTKFMTLADNIKFSKHKEVKGRGYVKYDNYDAIDVPFVDAIPNDYADMMGVPISGLDKINPDLFQIVALGNSRHNFTPNKSYVSPKKVLKNGNIVNGGAINCVLTLRQDQQPVGEIYYICPDVEGFITAPYARLIIKRK